MKPSITPSTSGSTVEEDDDDALSITKTIDDRSSRSLESDSIWQGLASRRFADLVFFSLVYVSARTYVQHRNSTPTSITLCFRFVVGPANLLILPRSYVRQETRPRLRVWTCRDVQGSPRKDRTTLTRSNAQGSNRAGGPVRLLNYRIYRVHDLDRSIAAA
jgi:hypothetical protein